MEPKLVLEPMHVQRVSWIIPNCGQLLSATELEQADASFIKSVTFTGLGHPEAQAANWIFSFRATEADKTAQLSATVDEGRYKMDGSVTVRVLIGLRDRQSCCSPVFLSNF
jgi:hypothetical protein